MKVAYKEFPFYTEGVNAWVDVQDVVDILHMLMKSDVEAERFILSTGSIAYKDVFTLMANALNKKPPHIKANSLMTGLAWRWDSLKNVLTGGNAALTKETVHNAQNKCFYNNSKLLKFFRSYAYTPVEQTINRMAGAFLKNIAEKN
jgi:dihydroflavonol-4-reductase